MRLKNKKIGIFFSSYNNYNILENETLKNNFYHNYPIINIDDHSNKKNFTYGRRLCKKNNIHFQLNKRKGVQYAANQAINFLKKKYNCEWVICMQQDNFFLDRNFLKKFENKIKKKKYKNFGVVGFNHLSEDNLIMNKNIVTKYYNKKKPKGALCIFCLSACNINLFNRIKFFDIIKYFVKSLLKKKNKKYLKNLCNSSRVFAPFSLKNFEKISKKYNGIFNCELPIWSTIAINSTMWKKSIRPRKGYIFHLWFVDIAFQFLEKNIKLCVDANLYLLNNQKIKEKYGFMWSSAHAGRKNLRTQVEKYGNHLKIFKKYWGFNYENIEEEYPMVQKKYKNTLIDNFFNHKYTSGPIKLNN